MIWNETLLIIQNIPCTISTYVKTTFIRIFINTDFIVDLKTIKIWSAKVEFKDLCSLNFPGTRLEFLNNIIKFSIDTTIKLTINGIFISLFQFIHTNNGIWHVKLCWDHPTNIDFQRHKRNLSLYELAPLLVGISIMCI